MIYLIGFTAIMLTHLGIYFFGRFTKGQEYKFTVEETQKFNQRAAKVLSRVEPTDPPPLGAVMWFGKPVKDGKVLSTVEPI